MSLTTKMQEQGGNPAGFIGRIIGKSMNIFHGNIHKWGLQKCSIRRTDLCLDIGCGGGTVVKALAKIASKGEIYGLDHSQEMVDLSGKVNTELIAEGSVKIDQGTVTSLPYKDNYFDLITAFETVQFWPSLDDDVKEVKRVLKPTGVLLIVNRYPPENSKWSDFLQLKNSREYNELLSSAGFNKIDIDDKSKKGWICILAGIHK